jgi:serine/threonine protein kinase
MIFFLCPQCGVNLKVKESRAGRECPCPKCNAQIRVPVGNAVAEAVARKPGSHPGTQPATKSEKPARPSSIRLRPGTASPTAETATPRAAETNATETYPFLAPAQGPDELGRLGPYVVRKVLGIGAMGVVFQAEDSRLKRQVALKVMRPSLASIDEYHRRFTREARLAAAIEHDNLVPIYEVGTDGAVPYLAMKLLLGETLEDRLNRIRTGMSPTESLRVAREIAEGLAVAHERSLIHRDIKPANIWLEAGRDRVKILDFGLARGTGEDGQFTRAGAVIGTPAYMSPEQAKAEDVDARCDLFSLGAVLYRTATGEQPFAGKDTLTMLAAVTGKTPIAPHKVNPALPQAFSELIMRLLAKDRNKRPQTAREIVTVIEDIERTRSAVPIPTPVDSTPADRGPAVAAVPPAAAAPTVPSAPVQAVPAAVPAEGDADLKQLRKRLLWFQTLAVSGVAVAILTIGLVFGLNRSDTAAAPPARQQKVEDELPTVLRDPGAGGRVSRDSRNR